ncbi:hypothetical protein MSUIS_01030 [Mycoplasma suis KI3806]|uniref:Uncharacterized protein n=1 Tax=Mycoplasma suis (strain KI_3806) TaxID=708248 RepID=F0V2X4_MYCS3|nr:hypothetical protein [Mycoplasma suis]CBZ40196.1 hypothetical protein MSUIS_01030 [Mycoplasma suis KI3806]
MGVSVITKVALVATSLGGLAGSGYFFRDNLWDAVQSQISKWIGTSSPKVIVEYVYGNKENDSKVTCEQILEKKASAVKLNEKDCQNLLSNMWKKQSIEQRPEILVKVNKKHLKDIFGEKVYSSFEISDSGENVVKITKDSHKCNLLGEEKDHITLSCDKNLTPTDLSNNSQYP